MLLKKSVRLTILAALVLVALASPKSALAWSGCGSRYVVQWGDTLWSVANNCGTTVEALRQANNLASWSWIYAGQSLSIPDGYQDGGNNHGGQYGGNNYGNQDGSNMYWNQDGGNNYGGQYGGNYHGNQDWGNNYGGQNGGNYYGYQDGSNYYGYQDGGNYYGCQDGGNYYGCQGSNGYYGYQDGYASYGGANAGTYVVQRGDTMRKIADRMGFSLSSLIAANPQIWNPNLIFAGQVICLPGSYMGQSNYYQGSYSGWNGNYQDGAYNDGWKYQKSSTTLYTIQHGDTLKDIARQYGTTVQAILDLNPSIKMPNRIYAGQVIRIW